MNAKLFSVSILVLVGLFDWFVWNGLFRAESIGEYIGFTILAVLSVALSIVVFIIAVALWHD